MLLVTPLTAGGGSSWIARHVQIDSGKSKSLSTVSSFMTDTWVWECCTDGGVRLAPFGMGRYK